MSSLNCSDIANEVQCRTEAQYRTDIGFATSLVINTFLMLLFFLLFVFFRKRVKPVYEPQSDINRVDHSKIVVSPNRGLFGWLTSAFRMKDTEIELKRGLDSVIYLLVTKYLFFIVLGYGLYGWCILFPVHATAVGVGLTGTAMLSMGNIPTGDARLTADLIGVFWNSALGCIGLYMLYKIYYEKRMQKKADQLKVENYTVMMREFPSCVSEEDIRKLFESIYPGKVCYVKKGYISKDVSNALDERQKMGLKLEEAQGYYVTKGKRKIARDKCCNMCIGEKVDAISFYEKKYRDANADLIISKTYAKDVSCSVAFITFNDTNTAKMASQTLLSSFKMVHPLQERWVVEAAPSPESVYWESLPVSHESRWVRSMFVNVATFLLIFFWMVPVAFASSLSNLATLSTLLPFLVPVLNLIPVIKGLIEGFLPGLVIIIFFAILVTLIITPLAKAEGQLSHVVVLTSVFNKYFLFVLFNIFLGSALASGILNVLPQVIANPTSAVSLIAQSLPGQATYFINYLMVLSLSGFTLALWRPGALIVRWILQKITNTKRGYRNAEGPYFFDMHVSYAIHCLVFIIASCYSILNPLILPFACIYYGMSYVTARYNLIYVFTPRFRGQEEIFPSVFNKLCLSLLVFQIVLVAILGLSSFPAAAAIIVAIILQCLFWYYTNKQFERGSKHGALVMYNDDLNDENKDNKDINVVPNEDAYEYVTLRTPLFQVENQSTNEQQLKHELWWKEEFTNANVDNRNQGGGGGGGGKSESEAIKIV